MEGLLLLLQTHPLLCACSLCCSPLQPLGLLCSPLLPRHPRHCRPRTGSGPCWPPEGEEKRQSARWSKGAAAGLSGNFAFSATFSLFRRRMSLHVQIPKAVFSDKGTHVHLHVHSQTHTPALTRPLVLHTSSPHPFSSLHCRSLCFRMLQTQRRDVVQLADQMLPSRRHEYDSFDFMHRLPPETEPARSAYFVELCQKTRERNYALNTTTGKWVPVEEFDHEDDGYLILPHNCDQQWSSFIFYRLSESDSATDSSQSDLVASSPSTGTLAAIELYRHQPNVAPPAVSFFAPISLIFIPFPALAPFASHRPSAASIRAFVPAEVLDDYPLNHGTHVRADSTSLFAAINRTFRQGVRAGDHFQQYTNGVHWSLKGISRAADAGVVVTPEVLWCVLYTLKIYANSLGLREEELALYRRSLQYVVSSVLCLSTAESERRIFFNALVRCAKSPEHAAGVRQLLCHFAVYETAELDGFMTSVIPSGRRAKGAKGARSARSKKGDAWTDDDEE